MLLISSSVITPVAGAGNETTTTPAGNETTTTTPDKTNVTKEEIVTWASQGRDITKSRAQELLSWFNSHSGEFDVAESKQVRDWLTSELTSGADWSVDTVVAYAKSDKDVKLPEAKSIYDWYLAGGNTDLTKKQRGIVSEWLKTQLSQSDGPATPTPSTSTNNTTSEKPSDYKTAKKAIKDGHVAEGELSNSWDIKNKEIGPIKVIAAEGNGETSTLIIKSSNPTMVSITDPVAIEHGDGAVKVPSQTLHSGYNVVQVKTMEFGGKEKVWVSAGGYIDDIKFNEKADIVPKPYRSYDVVLGFLLPIPLMVVTTLFMFRRKKNKPKSPGVAK
ncbi:hypothetical protein [Halorussus vallis]|uniref:hypothetical protein n=1 Tax=Halorussus vallis TaxID=2953749 RepID=UPI0020A0E142|nr:hypothetical protein [Halorussus vallis]